jgi:nitrite reductase/ring-hydroxylating ferredoxin subunit
MSDWWPVARADECPPGTCLERVVQGRVVALYNVEGKFFALDGICPHQGGPLGKGCLDGAIVTCPWHGWQFDVRTGVSRISPRIFQPTLEVRVQGQQVVVRGEKPLGGVPEAQASGSDE